MRLEWVGTLKICLSAFAGNLAHSAHNVNRKAEGKDRSMVPGIMETMGYQGLKPGAPGPSHLATGVTSHLSSRSLPLESPCEFESPYETGICFPRNPRRNCMVAHVFQSNQQFTCLRFAQKPYRNRTETMQIRTETAQIHSFTHEALSSGLNQNPCALSKLRTKACVADRRQRSSGDH
jgi:hypothetical protein